MIFLFEAQDVYGNTICIVPCSKKNTALANQKIQFKTKQPYKLVYKGIKLI